MCVFLQELLGLLSKATRVPRVAMHVLNVLNELIHVPKQEGGDFHLCKAFLADEIATGHFMTFIISHAFENGTPVSDIEFVAVHGMGVFQRLLISQGQAMLSFQNLPGDQPGRCLWISTNID